MSKAITSVLVANRGEIALRIFRTAETMGLNTVAVHSDADARAPFVRKADMAISIGPAEAAKSYLDIEKVITAARTSGADAIHPGYGFLSENTDLAAACEKANLRFIGPPASAIAAMGSKSAAKALMDKANVPLVPGYHGEDQDLAVFVKEAERIGFPLLIKASAGGGGKGMRIVRNAGELRHQLEAAQREAGSSFGDPTLLLERYLETPRHVEVQVLFDQHGTGVYLFDRDCSVQRRHQKIIEEAPAPGIPDDVRRSMGEAAVRCGEAIGYVGAGTVEFLYEPESHEFFFMEMNTRLQVEHPVTEMVTGLDLVEWQIRVANGEALPWNQDDLRCQGHAMEARVYAEDPDNGFLPQTGRLHTLHEPVESNTVRVDSGVCQGLEITPWYDPMLAKVIAFGDDRNAARINLIEALNRYHTDGVVLNTDYVSRVLRHDAFGRAELTTRFVEVHEKALLDPPFSSWFRKRLSLVAWMDSVGGFAHADNRDVWATLRNFRVDDSHWQPFELDLDADRYHGHYQVTEVALDHGRLTLCMDDEESTVRWDRMTDGALEVRLSGRRIRLDSAARGDELAVFADAATWKARINHPEVAQGAVADETELTAPMHGRVTALLCKPGEPVHAGQALLTMEAMKMEHTLKAGFDGTVEAVHCQTGSNVEAAQVLITLAQPED
ncbi:acetyl/propionyl/methylcrotonyl-CoA carboxylase subunit alpha [Marinobacter zhanjiangensis]|uniref:3-methylcrotonyl-CoA carboxylase subunit alpha n=1 Tax=Marinobacter zhanjiangensis TaxID=578215 RepID=A0ABQ3AUJ2_9GAMM|nr:biotin carboxylase N-terminal domain-containing protein [Marinobacter zhanjiangensis]GGY67038.1 3-methylcrotonyl-CoA carboxylase subunit alpha [Marinobacter zhanjiangensis]